MLPALTRPALGVALAITITTLMDATGLAMFSALPLFPLLGLFWYLERLPRRDMGFVWGRWEHYGLALLYPILVIGSVAAVSFAAGAINVSQTDWNKAGVELALVAGSTALVTIVTEEGFFRGWLWASLRRTGMPTGRTLLWSSIAFTLWHVSPVTLETGFDLPAAQIPVYLLNATVMGAAWGLLRWLSGSVIVASVSHGLWNGLAYVFFGFGTKVGALGIENTVVFGPEVGVLGLGLNAGFLVAFWLWARDRLAVKSEDGSPT